MAVESCWCQHAFEVIPHDAQACLLRVAPARDGLLAVAE
jgi:hypothetical protein